MHQLIEQIEKLKKIPAKKTIDQKIISFAANKDHFSELCFCILTANFNALGGIRIQNEIGKGFLTLSQQKLAQKLRSLGHRFPNTRAAYIVEARKHDIKSIIKKIKDETELRAYIAQNIKGLGYKEASHFLRNIGFKNLAIIDFHIIDLLTKHKIIRRPKILTKKRYLEIEKAIKKLADKCNLSLAELDLYLWYIETGKILK